MRTNTAADINTNWQLNGIVKPAHVNALTRSIIYDYVVTREMLDEWPNNEIDVDELLGGSKIRGVSGEYHVLINAAVPANKVLLFKADRAGSEGDADIHIHSLQGYSAKISGTEAHCHLWFHTTGSFGAVSLVSVGANTHVGAFDMEAGVNVPSGGEFIYERAISNLPESSDPGTVISKEMWLSNGSGSDQEEVLILYDETRGPTAAEAGARAQELLGKGLLPVLYTANTPTDPDSQGHISFSYLAHISMGCDLLFYDQWNSQYIKIKYNSTTGKYYQWGTEKIEDSGYVINAPDALSSSNPNVITNVTIFNTAAALIKRHFSPPLIYAVTQQGRTVEYYAQLEFTAHYADSTDLYRITWHVEAPSVHARITAVLDSENMQTEWSYTPTN